MDALGNISAIASRYARPDRPKEIALALKTAWESWAAIPTWPTMSAARSSGRTRAEPTMEAYDQVAG